MTRKTVSPVDLVSTTPFFAHQPQGCQESALDLGRTSSVNLKLIFYQQNEFIQEQQRIPIWDIQLWWITCKSVSSVSVVSNSFRPHELQHTRLPCPSPTPRASSNSCPSSRWCHPTIHPSHLLSSPSLLAFSLSQHQDLFQWVSSSHQVAKVLELHLQHQSFQWIFRTDFL